MGDVQSCECACYAAPLCKPIRLNEALESEFVFKNRVEEFTIPARVSVFANKSVTKNYQTCGCNDYVLAEVPEEVNRGDTEGKCYVVLNPRNIVLVRPRDRKDHVTWLVEHKRFEEALEQIELLPDEGINAKEIGQRYIDHLINEGKWPVEFDQIVAYIFPGKRGL